MPDTPRQTDPAAATITDFDAANPLRPGATRLRGATRRGKTCELVDNSGDELPLPELQAILDALIREEQFGFATVTWETGANRSYAVPASGSGSVTDSWRF